MAGESQRCENDIRRANAVQRQSKNLIFIEKI